MNEDLAKRYREEQIEQQRQRELNILRSPGQQFQNQQRSVVVHDEDSMAVDVMISSRRTARPGDSPGIPLHQQSTETKTGPSNFATSAQQLPAAANVVTNL